ncbi:UNVERIFIED_CONTAM: hypothetical protein RMT77_018620 [Armadillidium vulgare]
MSNKKFPYLNYNLSKNFVHINEERRLSHIVLEMIIVFTFNEDEIKNEVIKFKIRSELIKKEKIPKNWIEIEDNVCKRVSETVPSHFLSKIQSAVPFIGSQIYFLLGKITSDEDRTLFLQHMVLNISGTVNTLSTALKILSESENSNEWKFLFACKYFVGEEIINYFRLLPSPVKKWCANFKHSDCKNECYWLCFNLWHIRKTTEVFKDYIEMDANNSEMSSSDEAFEKKVIEVAFEKAVKNGNENGVYFIFENYISNSAYKNSILENVLKEKLYHFDMTNIAIYIFSQIDDGELPSWFEIYISYILEKLFRDSRFHIVLLQMVNDLQSVLAKEKKLSSLLYKLRLIIDSKVKRGFKRDAETEYRDTFMKVIDKLSVDSTDSIFKSDKDIYNNLLKYVFDQLDGQIAKKLLKAIITDMDNQSRSMLSYVVSGSLDSFWIVPLARYDINFIEEMFSAFLNDKQCSSMLNWLYINYANDLAIYFIVSHRFENINLFQEWTAYASSVQENFIKKKITYNDLLAIVKTIIFGVEGLFKLNLFFRNKFCEININPTEDPMKYIDEILNWCLKDSKAVANYKKKLPRYLSTKFYDCIRNWANDFKYEEIDKVFAWLSNSGNEVRETKKKLCNDNQIMDAYCSNGLFEEYLHFIDRFYIVDYSCFSPVKRITRI